MNNFKGVLDEYPFIAVDYFQSESLECSVFFLSHCHTDHMVGMSEDAFCSRLAKSPEVKFYCSILTRELILGHGKFQHLEPFMIPLEVNVPISLSVSTGDNFQHLSVTLLSAGHCPGSVMFLFEGDNGNVLHTGDFRLTSADLIKMNPLFTSGTDVKPIRKLYIDTTFCTLDALELPSRQASRDAIVNVIETWLQGDPQNLVCLRGSAQFGIEYIYVQIKEKFNMKVHVLNHTLRKYSAVQEIFDAVTIDGRVTRIHACRNPFLPDDWNNGTNYCAECRKHWDKSLQVKLSTQWFVYSEKRKLYKQQRYGINGLKPSEALIHKNERRCRVWFSMHSSLREILDVVKFLKPKIIMPLVVNEDQTLDEVLRLLYSQLQKDNGEATAIVDTMELPTSMFGTLNNHTLRPLEGEKMSLELVSSLESQSLNFQLKRRNDSATEEGCESPKHLKNSSIHDVDSENRIVNSPKWNHEPFPIKSLLQNSVSSNGTSQESITGETPHESPQWSYKPSPVKRSSQNSLAESQTLPSFLTDESLQSEKSIESLKWTYEPSPVKNLSQNSHNSSQTSVIAGLQDSPQWTYQPSPVKVTLQSSLTESKSPPSGSIDGRLLIDESTNSPKCTYEPSTATSSQSSIEKDPSAKVLSNSPKVCRQLSFSRCSKMLETFIKKSSPEVIDITTDSNDTIELNTSDSMTPEILCDS